MNRLCVILSLTFNLAFGQNQPLTGRYIANDNYVVITDSSLEFMTSYGCCLLLDIYGYGKYTMHHDSIYVFTGEPTLGHGSTYQTLGDLSTSDKISIKVQNKGQPVQSCYVTLDDKSTNKIIHGASTDASGLALLDSLPTDHIENRIVTVYSLGYDRFEIPLNEITGKSILVNLSDYEVLRDKQVAFKLLSDSSSTKLIGPFFPISKEQLKKQKKDFRKHRKEVSKHNTKLVLTQWPWYWERNWNYDNRNNRSSKRGRHKQYHVPTTTVFVRQ